MERWTSGARTSAAANPKPVVRVKLAQPVPGRPRGRYVWPLLALPLIVGLALHFRDRLAPHLRSRPAAEVRVAPVRSGALERTLRLTGTTAAEHGVYLRIPRLRGHRSRGGGARDFRLELREVAEPGSHVKKGDVVAVFDRQYMLNRLDDSRAERAESEADLTTLRALLDVERTARRQQIRVAKGNMDKAALDLKTAPVRSAIQIELLKLAFAEARARYDALLKETRYVESSARAQTRYSQLDLRRVDVELRRAEANAGRMVARAPFDGLVVMQQTFRGGQFSQIRAGDELRPGQTYMQVVDARSLIVEARANQADVKQVRIGAPAHTRFDAFPALELPARVYSIGSLAHSRGQRPDYVREVPVRLRLERVDPRAIPSLSVSADIVLEREQSAAIIPREATLRDADGGRPFAYVRAPRGWERRELELGLGNSIAVAVRSGLSEGEIVALERLPGAG